MNLKNKFASHFPKRDVDGVLLLDKPVGITSNAALQRVKAIYHARKAGHTGSLDPLASGVLPICFGEATKFSQFLLEADKVYEVTARLGVRTTTSDREGEVVSERPVPDLSIELLENALNTFRGDTKQVPSMYSALKYQGQPLYQLARRGITVEVPARLITIFELNLIHFTRHEIKLYVHCSKGTYVRTLVDDLGETLGCGAHVTQLRRLRVAHYKAENRVTLPQIRSVAENKNKVALDHFLLPIDSMLSSLPSMILDSGAVFYLQRGQTITLSHLPDATLICLKNTRGDFLGVGEIMEERYVKPKRLVKINP